MEMVSVDHPQSDTSTTDVGASLLVPTHVDSVYPYNELSENSYNIIIKDTEPKKRSCTSCLTCLVVLLVAGVILAVAGGVMYPVVDMYIREQVKQKVILSNTSETYEIWQDVPVPVYMQFYIFTIGNPEEVRQGKTPFVEQVGPFTYRERRVKYGIQWNGNGTVTYRQNRTFFFHREMSVHDEDFEITTINPLIATIAQNVQFWNGNLQKLFSWALGLVSNEDIIMTRPVKELLWGYDDPALALLRTVDPRRFKTKSIGYFIRKNYTDDGLYTVQTGQKDINQLGHIDEYNGAKNLDLWTSPWANMLNGTDGTMGPPFRFDTQFAPVFVSDICRSIRGIYTEDVETPQGIRLRRYGGDRRDMLNATANPDNIGFCTPQTRCLPTGLLNSTLCQEPVDGFDLPVIFSFPHFLYAHPSVQESVVGINPIKKEHETVIDEEPWTGLVLQVAKRLQINMYVRKDPNIKQTHNIQTLFFPILWINESSVVDDKWANKLQDELFTPMKIANIGKIATIALGSFLVVLSSGLLFYQRRKANKVRYA